LEFTVRTLAWLGLAIGLIVAIVINAHERPAEGPAPPLTADQIAANALVAPERAALDAPMRSARPNGSLRARPSGLPTPLPLPPSSSLLRTRTLMTESC